MQDARRATFAGECLERGPDARWQLHEGSALVHGQLDQAPGVVLAQYRVQHASRGR